MGLFGSDIFFFFAILSLNVYLEELNHSLRDSVCNLEMHRFWSHNNS